MAFCKTAAIAHQIALERAKYLDGYYAKNNKTVGPLHGLPISLKDQFHVKGVDTTMGALKSSGHKVIDWEPPSQNTAKCVHGLAYENRYSDYWNSTAEKDAYTEAMNLMNYAIVVIQVTNADKRVDVADDSYKPLNAKDRLNWESYDPDIYDNAPVGVQIVARKFEEEKILAVAKIVCAALQTKNVP
ncbi:hypothetical protein G7Z17_g9283 [Cylindrodendrum hubeiense]|uniref:Amidase domain-containing protein n=1 Tax=Cylindrodendrum hubeiense TaxID=595255 RepID=A0A9P5H722_9HYPO|nr:hypothetical protein G7Z17_g9283 [Cylindrodendrum hubeiense]